MTFGRSAIAFFISFLVGTMVTAQPLKLVGTESVQDWDGKIVTQLNCVVSTQVNRDVAAYSGAKLSFVAPVGKSFSKGDLLAQQESYFLTQALERMQVELKSAQLDAEYNEKEYQRLSSLEPGLVSQSQLNLHSLNKHKALLATERLSNEIEQQQELLKRLSFYAEGDGQVTTVETAVGGFVNRSQSILSYYLEDDKELSCQSPVVGDNNVQAVGEFTLTDGSALQINRIGKKVHQDSQNRTVFLAIPSSHGDKMEVGLRVKVNQSQLLAGTHSLSKLPSDALTMSSKDKYVWRVSDDGTIAKVDVKVLSNLPDYFLVESSLNAGDQVITIGKGGLQPEQKVMVKGTEAAKL